MAFLDALNAWEAVSPKTEFFEMCLGSYPECAEFINFDFLEINDPLKDWPGQLVYAPWYVSGSEVHWGDTLDTRINHAIAGNWTFDQKKWLLAHEMGHVMGLADLCDGDGSVSIMAKVDQCTYIPTPFRTTPGSDDAAGITAIYEHEP